MSNQYLEEGDSLVFGALNTDAKFFDALEDVGLKEYQEYQFEIAAIQNERLAVSLDYKQLQQNGITVAISEEILLQSPIFKGIKSIDIYLKEGITEVQ